MNKFIIGKTLTTSANRCNLFPLIKVNVFGTVKTQIGSVDSTHIGYVHIIKVMKVLTVLADNY